MLLNTKLLANHKVPCRHETRITDAMCASGGSGSGLRTLGSNPTEQRSNPSERDTSQDPQSHLTSMSLSAKWKQQEDIPQRLDTR